MRKWGTGTAILSSGCFKVTLDEINAKWMSKSGVLQQPSLSERHVPSLLSGLSVAVCTYNRHSSLERFLNSLETQNRLPETVLIVDAGSDDLTESMLISRSWRLNRIVYLRVGDSLRGLTRQRNVALDWCSTDLIAFFDDDIVMEMDCLKELETTIRNSHDIVGVGSCILNEDAKPGFLWNSLYRLGAMPDLTPGKYQRSGLVAPLRLLGEHQSEIDVDRLPGGCTIWRTALAQKVRFNDIFHGYAQSEDLEFSRRIAKYGRLVISGKAQVRHLHEMRGRADQIQLGRMGIVNRHYIHRTTLPDRQWQDALWFIYAQGLYIAFSTISMFLQKRGRDGFYFALGALLGVGDIVRGTRS